MIVFRPSPGFVFSHPAHAIAFGFGAGLAPFAPGTAGTALGWAIGWALGGVHPGILFFIVVVFFVLGLWACGLTGRHLGIADHGGMVWDEVAAFLLVLAIVPGELAWQAAAFVAFRFFDIAKPPPIRHLERRYGGGFGVMFDDLVAAAYTLLLLAAVKRLFL
ncbi:MAG TPA: phosphatidylglycerophosphatase A [Burkholderiales bacterium]|nr:phosphatidylglycerophosphatase A [Burkholderiales bacterium]